MNNRPGPHEGSTEHLADAGGSSVGDHEGPTTPTTGDGLCDGLMPDAGDEPRLAAFLDRSADVLQAGPDEFTAHRHLVAMRKEAAAAAPARPRVLRTASISAAAAVALVVTLAGFGALPAPAQQVLADVADRVGITIPSPADRVPGGEVPAKQQPPETIPGRPGGAERYEWHGLTQEGTLQTPGMSDGDTPPGRTDGHSSSDEAPDRDRDVPEAPVAPPAPAPPGEDEQPPPEPEQPSAPVERAPDEPEQPPSQPAPPDPPPPPEPPAVEDPPASGQGSGAPGKDPGPGGQTGGDRP